ncbi:hypothetical protein Trydic_g19064 [Trypoxylus dichotomus]
MAIQGKGLLLLDNASSHPLVDEVISEDDLITRTSMPPCVAPLIQPINQNISTRAELLHRSTVLSLVLAKKVQKHKCSFEELESAAIKRC